MRLSPSNPTPEPARAAFALFAAFFALYALTAQRGLSWGDSGEFQYRILTLADGVFAGCESLATAHPLYVAFGKLVCATPFQVTLLSSFFGALAVCGLFLATRRIGLAVLFGLSHALWWLSTLAEVQTMNLAFTAFEAFLLMRMLERPRARTVFFLFFLNAIHLWVHHFALLALPVYAAAVLVTARHERRAALPLAAVLGWLPAGGLPCAAFASAAFRDGISAAVRTFLVGRYGGQVAGVLPSDTTRALVNLALMAMSFAVPVMLVRFAARDARANRSGADAPASHPGRVFLWTLFLVHALFVVRYFVPDQFTFALPALFYAYLLVAHVRLKKNRLVALALIQLLLPLAAMHAFASMGKTTRPSVHPGRDDAAYFALPWKFTETSAARYAECAPSPWKGYP